MLWAVRSTYISNSVPAGRITCSAAPCAALGGPGQKLHVRQAQRARGGHPHCAAHEVRARCCHVPWTCIAVIRRLRILWPCAPALGTCTCAWRWAGPRARKYHAVSPKQVFSGGFERCMAQIEAHACGQRLARGAGAGQSAPEVRWTLTFRDLAQNAITHE